MRLVTAAALSAFHALQGLPVFAQSFEEGLSAAQSGDFATALQHFEPLAEQGHPDAQLKLGFMYANGQGVAQNHAEALLWFQRAAEQGYASAQGRLGFMYANGNGVTQDYAEAATWFRRAAVQGDAEALLRLGFMYQSGVSVSRNAVLAYMLSNLAAAQGNETARDNRDTILKDLTSEQITEGQRLASDWQVGSPLSTTQDVTTWP